MLVKQSASGQFITVCKSQRNLESNRAYDRTCIGQSLGPGPISTSVLRPINERGTNQVFFLSWPIGPPFNLLIIAGSSANRSILWSCGKGVYDVLMARLPCERGIIRFLISNHRPSFISTNFSVPYDDWSYFPTTTIAILLLFVIDPRLLIWPNVNQC